MSTDAPIQGATIGFAGVLANAISFNGPHFHTEGYQVTYIGDLWERSTPTTIKVDPIKCEFGYDPGLHSALLTALVAKTVAALTVTLPGISSTGNTVAASTFTCEYAYVSDFEVIGGTSKDQSKINVEFTVSGSVTGS